MKSTKQKGAILAAVHTMRNHPTADEIYHKLRLDFPNISLGTVYRNLNLFAVKGEISKVMIPGAGDRFDYRIDRHEHLLCDRCGRIFDINVQVDIIVNEADVNTRGYNLLVYGVCRNCSND